MVREDVWRIFPSEWEEAEEQTEDEWEEETDEAAVEFFEQYFADQQLFPDDPAPDWQTLTARLAAQARNVEAPPDPPAQQRPAPPGNITNCPLPA